MAHRLTPLLNPKSLAIVGASGRPHSVGHSTIQNVLGGKYPGAIYPINPSYDELEGLPCYPSFGDLPEAPELAIFCVSDTRVEEALKDAIAAGIKAALLISTMILPDDVEPPLQARVSKIVSDAGIVAAGPNGMGFYNVSQNLWACGFQSRSYDSPGVTTLISHSGSGMCGIADCERRIRFNLAVSTGNEIDATMDEYIDYALDLPDTRVISLFIETARKPAGLVASLEKANQLKIPVIAMKVGRTAKSAAMAESHSGALAGDDAAWQALFDRYGVQRFDDMDDFADAMVMFGECPVPGPGGLVALHDSGGERQLLIDLAEDLGVELTELQPETIAAIDEIIDPELPAVNPLDGWSQGGPDHDETMTQCLTLLMSDPGAALGMLQHDRGPDGVIFGDYLGYMERARAESGKSVALVSVRQGTGADDRVAQWTHDGYPVLDGMSGFLKAARAMFAYRDFINADADPPNAPSGDTVTKWSTRLSSGQTMTEKESLAMLADFGISANVPAYAASEAELHEVASNIEYPAVLKTAAPGINHKSDVGGVILNLASENELVETYKKMSSSLGPQAIVSSMISDGIEMILGAKQDSQFGPVVLIGFGGIYAETLKDVRFALPPFGPTKARAMLDELRLRPMLDGQRGAPAASVDAFCQFASKFSAMVYALRERIAEIDINPVLACPDNAIAVDALVIPVLPEED